jgi:hypothetical protein
MATMMDSDCNNDEQQLRQQWRYKAVRVCKLYGNGVQKRRENFFFLLFRVFFFLSSSSSSSIAITRATHYMTTNLETHKSA